MSGTVAQEWQIHAARCGRSQALLLGGGHPLFRIRSMLWCSHAWREAPPRSGIVAPNLQKGKNSVVFRKFG